MSRSYPLPGFLLSTRAGFPRSFSSWLKIAGQARVDGLDVDLTSWSRRWGLRDNSWFEIIQHPSVRSVWIHSWQLLRVINHFSVNGYFDSLSPVHRKVIILQPENNSTLDDFNNVVKIVAKWRKLFPSSVTPRFALALQPANPHGGREHLQQLQLLRYLAAEWDLDFAVDLLGRLDPTWEAEAAIFKISSRLQLARIPYVPLPTQNEIRAIMTHRVITAAIDARFMGFVSVAPPLRFWEIGNGATLTTTIDAIETLQHQVRTRRSVTISPPGREPMY